MHVRDDILELAKGEGFDLVRIAPASKLSEQLTAARDAFADGCLDGMDWITSDWLERAADPRAFLAGANSVVMVGLSYRRGVDSDDRAGDGVLRGRVASYAQGRDYHRVFEKRIRRIARLISERHGVLARPTVDYGPLLERPLAAVAGMGWTGKSTMLLVPGVGPWVLLGAVATSLELQPDLPLRKSCGACTRCISACPTGALSADGRLDARRCISYHTIENRGDIPRELRPRFGAWVFGCDECLTSCSVGANSRSDAPHSDLVAANPEAASPALVPLLTLTDESFGQRFRGRAIMRAKRDGLARNACIALGNTGTAEDMNAVAAALEDRSPIVRGHAAWAIGRLAVRHGAREAATECLSSRFKVEDNASVREELLAATRDAD